MNRRHWLRRRIFHGWAALLAAFLFLGRAPAAEKIRVAIGTEGPVNDMGFYQGGYQGVLKLKENPGVTEVTFQERVKLADLELSLRKWASSGYNLIFGHGYEWGEPALKVASQFPDTVFAIATFFNTKDHPNVITYQIQAHEAGYVVGVLAALMSKNKQVGVLGGFPVPVQMAEHNAYRLGGRSVDPNLRVRNVFINNWFDTVKAKEATLALIGQGVDVIHGTASPIGFGVIKAAEEKGVYAVGPYADVGRVAPDTVLTSTVFVWHTVMNRIVQDMRKGKVEKVYIAGLKDGGVVMAPFNRKVPPEVAEKVRAVERKIKSGALQVPFLGDKAID